jgi:hypothetical protein
MAEFKISRLRYTWKETWGSGTEYNKDDVVRYGGASWVCVRQHTASAFASDQVFLENINNTEVSPAWIKMTDGYEFRGLWTPNTLYNPGDIVINGGNLYLCVVSYTASSIFDEGIDNWIVYNSGDSYKNLWTQNTRYGIGDVVKYNGIVYRCIEGHTSADTASGLEQDQLKWEIVYEGVEYRDDWSAGTQYQLNDLVKFGGTVFRCKQGHTSSTSTPVNFEQAEYWDVEFPGFQYSGEWSETTVYQVGDIVKHGGWLYYSLVTNYDRRPGDISYQSEEGIIWQIASKGINFKGDWSATEFYKTGDVVRHGGNTYVALLDTTDAGSSLDYLDNTSWELLTVGQNWKNFWRSEQRYAPTPHLPQHSIGRRTRHQVAQVPPPPPRRCAIQQPLEHSR